MKKLTTACVSIACLGLSIFPVHAGLFPTEVETSTLEPACLEINAGGITGPGTGITITNKCTYNITITQVLEQRYTTSTPQDDVSIYISNAVHPEKYPRNPRYQEFKLGTTGAACTGLSPIDSLCQSITIEPTDDLLIFTPLKFTLKGEPHVKIVGASRFD